jgi:hypothetical protein
MALGRLTRKVWAREMISMRATAKGTRAAQLLALALLVLA